MRYSNLFSRTKRDAPADLTDETLRLAFRAGLVRPAEHGQLLFLTLASNVISQMHLLLRGELKELGAQQVLGMSHFNLDALASAEIQSYKQLPARLYWTSDSMTRLHLASLEPSLEAAQAAHRAFEKIIQEFFEYAGVEPALARDLASAQLWYATAPRLDLEIFSGGSSVVTRTAATPFKGAPSTEAPLPMQEVETPHADTIEALAQLLQVPTNRTAKAVFYATGDRVIFAVIRGDLQIDESKVKRALGVDTLRWATEQEITRVGAVPGYASPIGTRGATIIVDDSIVHSPNLVAGANKAGYHLLNTNAPRDYKPDLITDIALARAGDTAPDGVGTLALERGIALGSLTPPRQLAANFLDPNGKAQKQHAVSMELDFGAILLAHIATHHDDKGITWSRALAPYDVYIVALNADKPEVAPALETLNDALTLAGLERLLDDRNESAGVKFNDADLIGLPLRITIGPKTVAQGGVEIKARTDPDAHLVTFDALADELDAWTGFQVQSNN